MIHNIVPNLPENTTICELGNREGLSTISILDSLNQTNHFITYDVVDDLRFVDLNKIEEQKKSFQFVKLDCLSEQALEIIQQTCKEHGNISLLFCDTVHTYEQLSQEFELYEPFLADEAIILVDDIQDNYESEDPVWHRTKYRFYKEWKGDKYDLTDLCHYPTGFAAFTYRRKK